MLSFDQFGIEFLGVERIFLPRDIERVRAIASLIKLRLGKQIVLSQDICFKTSLLKYGGFGYAHILRDMLAFMRKEGISQEEIDDMLMGNPARVFSGQTN